MRIIAWLLLFVSQYSFSCATHYYETGLTLNGSHIVTLIPPSFVSTSLHKKHEINIYYQQPTNNDAAILEISGTKNISFSEKQFQLDGTSGEIKLSLTVNEHSFGLVLLKVSGTQEGKKFIESHKFFVQAKQTS